MQTYCKYIVTSTWYKNTKRRPGKAITAVCSPIVWLCQQRVLLPTTKGIELCWGGVVVVDFFISQFQTGNLPNYMGAVYLRSTNAKTYIDHNQDALLHLFSKEIDFHLGAKWTAEPQIGFENLQNRYFSVITKGRWQLKARHSSITLA